MTFSWDSRATNECRYWDRQTACARTVFPQSSNQNNYAVKGKEGKRRSVGVSRSLCTASNTSAIPAGPPQLLLDKWPRHSIVGDAGLRPFFLSPVRQKRLHKCWSLLFTRPILRTKHQNTCLWLNWQLVRTLSPDPFATSTSSYLPGMDPIRHW